MNSGVYAIRHIGSARHYVGSSLDMNERRRRHFRDLAAGRHFNRYLQHTFSKYGAEQFEWIVLEESVVADLLTNEETWIRKLDTTNPERGFNITSTPSAPMRSLRHTAEARSRMGRKGDRHHNSKLTSIAITELVKMYNQGCSQEQIARQLAVDQTTVSDVLRGKSWRHCKVALDRPRANNTSGVVGVSFVNGKWKAQIWRDGTNKCLGKFATKEDAVAARKRAEEGCHGI